MECEFCEYYGATVAVSKGTIAQAACSACSNMLGQGWEIWDIAD